VRPILVQRCNTAQHLRYVIGMARNVSAVLSPVVDAKINQIIKAGNDSGLSYAEICARVKEETGQVINKSTVSRRLAARKDPVERIRVPEGPQAEIAVSDDPAIAVARRDWVTIRVSECLAEVFACTMETHDYFTAVARASNNRAEIRQARIDARETGKALTTMYAEIKSVHEAAQAASVSVVFDFGGSN
jgi:hypothetical protein